MSGLRPQNCREASLPAGEMCPLCLCAVLVVLICSTLR